MATTAHDVRTLTALFNAAQRPGMNVTDLCAVAGVARRTFYNVKKRVEAKGSTSPFKRKRNGPDRKKSSEQELAMYVAVKNSGDTWQSLADPAASWGPRVSQTGC
jgi:transposase